MGIGLGLVDGARRAAYASRILGYSSLVSYKRLGDAAASPTAVDAKNVALNGAAANVTFGTAGLVNGTDTAATFPGVTSTIDCPSNAAFDLTAAFSIEAWFKYTGNGANQWIVGKDSDTLGRSYSFGLVFVAGTTYRIHCQINGTNVAIGTTALVQGTRYHGVFTYDNANARGYLNGAIELAPASVSPAVSTGPLCLGRRTFAGFNENYVGVMDEVAIYNAVLTPAQIAANFNAGA